MKTLGLYLHIPYCIRKCRYCDFYSIPEGEKPVPDAYVEAVCAHMKEYAVQTADYAITTIYFGGGTPSLLSVEQLKRLMKALKSSFHLSKSCEISMETNPKTVELSKLRAFRRTGINRLSLGMQSFNDRDLCICGRAHTASDAVEAFTLARKAGFSNISLDLMYGIPGQTLQSVTDNINTAISLEPEHISFYGLKLEEGTPFWRERNELEFPDEESERSMYFISSGLLERAGYHRYEISNFSRRGYACKHNLRYWNCDEYIGFGPAAHSYFGGKRFSLKKNVGLYIDSFDPEKSVSEPLVDEYIDIPYSSRVAEYVMLRMRLAAGVHCDAFRKRFGRDFDEIYADRLRPYLQSGHVVKTEKGYAFSPEGMYVSTYILARVVDFDLILPGSQN